MPRDSIRPHALAHVLHLLDSGDEEAVSRRIRPVLELAQDRTAVKHPARWQDIIEEADAPNSRTGHRKGSYGFGHDQPISGAAEYDDVLHTALHCLIGRYLRCWLARCPERGGFLLVKSTGSF
jgi:hypothetical protein